MANRKSPIPQSLVKRVIRQLLLPVVSHRLEVVDFGNNRFLEAAMVFLKKVATAKAKNETIDADWYKDVFLDKSLPKNEIATNAGINMKTIGNSYGSGKMSTVIDASNISYESIKRLVGSLIEKNSDTDMTIVINTPNGSAELDINESFIVISALAAKHAALGGGLWSSIGKQGEKPLVHVLCNLYSVAPENYNLSVEDGSAGKNKREVDFFLVKGNTRYQGEVKIVGRGNPENMDGPIARRSHIVIADSLSERNIRDLESEGIKWVKLEEDHGHHRFAKALKEFGIPHEPYKEDWQENIDEMINRAFDECGSY